MTLQSSLELPLSSRNPKEVYHRIRNYLAGRLVGATRDRALLEEVIKCLFCRVYFLQHRVDGLSYDGADPLAVSKFYRSMFREIKEALPRIFTPDEEIILDPQSIQFVDRELSTIDLLDPLRDPLGDAYEAFASSSLRQQEGQFFTPLNVTEWLVDALDPKENETVMDPACGAGGFLSAAARYKLRKGGDPSKIADSLFGIEKDKLLAHLAESHIAITTLGAANIVCADALSSCDEDGNKIDPKFSSQFDVVLSNPPFGAKIVAASDDVRREYDLGFRWKKNKTTGIYEKLSTSPKNVPPQILFVEKIISLVRDGGRLGIVLPESMISNSTYSHVVQYIRERMTISAVIGMPEVLFKSSGKGGTHTKVCLLVAEKRKSSPDDQVYMAEAKWCGHDSRGRTIPNDDLPGILREYKSFSNPSATPSLGYKLDVGQISSNILCPRYYEPTAKDELLKLSDTHDLLVVGDLVERGILSLSTGDEPGKLAYGTGDIPFVRTSDISNWEIKFDPKHCVSEEIYSRYKNRQDVREGDILFVRDGTYLIGSCGYVSGYDEKIVYQSHLYKIRSNDWDYISPFLLLAAFSCGPVISQIQSKRFTQDIIDTIGARINELVLPIPKDREIRLRIERLVKKAIEDRIEARELARQAKLDICAFVN